MTARRTLLILTLATFAIPCIALAERTETRLDGNDWTLDGIPVLVPPCWNKIDAADGNPALADDTKIYSAVPATSYLRATRTYSRPLPGAKPGRRYFIRCEGASQKATVRVNGVAIGSHKGSFTAFCYEATAAMKPDGNRLDIEVSNEYDPTIPPASGGFNIHGGLYRSVWLIETDPVCIDPTIYGGPGVRVFPSMDGTVRVEADVSGADDAVVDWEPKKVENPRLWSPEEPNVYTVKVTVRKGEWSDSVEQPFGFRTTEIRADGFYLNGVKRKVRGVSRHQDLEGLGWEVSDAQEELDIRLVKAAGADGLRLAHYPQRENVYSLCDRYGLMVWSEIPVVNELGGDAFMENAKETLREMIAQHRNHPCVCWWGMWNEIFNMASPDAAWARKAFEFAPLAAELDPSRPIVAASYKEIGRVSPEHLLQHLSRVVCPAGHLQFDEARTGRVLRAERRPDDGAVRIRRGRLGPPAPEPARKAEDDGHVPSRGVADEATHGRLARHHRRRASLGFVRVGDVRFLARRTPRRRPLRHSRQGNRHARPRHLERRILPLQGELESGAAPAPLLQAHDDDNKRRLRSYVFLQRRGRRAEGERRDRRDSNSGFRQVGDVRRSASRAGRERDCRGSRRLARHGALDAGSRRACIYA